MSEETARLFTVTDERGTTLKPLEANFTVDYKYREEEEAVRVMEGDIERGVAVDAGGATAFPAADASKGELEYSEVRVEMKEPQGWNAYSAKSRVRRFEIPRDGEEIKLDAKSPGKQGKDTQKDALSSKLDTKRDALKRRFPPKEAEELKKG